MKNSPMTKTKTPKTPTLHLLEDRILVRVETEEKLLNGVWHPGDPNREDEAFHKATVIARGPGKTYGDGTFQPTSVAPGDKVLVYWFAVAQGKGKAKGPAGPFDSIMSAEAGQRPYGDDRVVIRESDIRLVYADA